MEIIACVQNREKKHHVTLCTNENVHSIVIPPKSNGLGSSVNGGELLFLALATCYCNDFYREAVRRDIKVENIEVEVNGDFEAEGASATNVAYRVKVAAHASPVDLQALIMHTDEVAEIHNTLRTGTPVTLDSFEAVAV